MNGGSDHALLAGDFEQQIQPQIALLPGEAVVVFVVTGDHRFDACYLQRAESHTLVHRGEFFRTDEVAPEATPRRVVRTMPVLHHGPDPFLVFNPRGGTRDP